MEIEAVVVGVGVGAPEGDGSALLAGVLTVIGSSRLSSDFGCMAMPTPPMTPPMTSAPSRMVNGNRTRSSLLGCDGRPVNPT